MCYRYPYEVGDGVCVGGVGPQPCGFGKVAYPHHFVFLLYAEKYATASSAYKSAKRRKEPALLVSVYCCIAALLCTIHILSVLSPSSCCVLRFAQSFFSKGIKALKALRKELAALLSFFYYT